MTNPDKVSGNRDKEFTDGRPPILGSWNNIYLLILGVLAVLIGLFYWFSISFR